VKFKGQLVKAGTIQFHSKDAGTFRAPIRDNGTYSLSDLPTGDLVVTIETESANPDIVMPTYGGKPAPAAGGGAAMPEAAAKQIEGLKLSKSPPPPQPSRENYVKIPQRYSDPAQSGLTVNLGRGSQTKDFDLTE
jgi:hypothetical protein